jgi:hypothetical protein
VETLAYPIFIFAPDLMSYCAPDLCTSKVVIYQSFSFGAKFVNCAPINPGREGLGGRTSKILAGIPSCSRTLSLLEVAAKPTGRHQILAISLRTPRYSSAQARRWLTVGRFHQGIFNLCRGLCFGELGCVFRPRTRPLKKFAADHPRFDQDLAEAYKLAERFNPTPIEQVKALGASSAPVKQKSYRLPHPRRSLKQQSRPRLSFRLIPIEGRNPSQARP